MVGLRSQMAKSRSYRLLCPIARGLDRVGDRWTLLILRDLHASPARFGELQQSLPGLASNLLSTRLEQLRSDGLIVHQPLPGGGAAYALTPLGEQTAPLLFELASFGSQFPAPDDLRRPGNLRTVVVTLQESLRRVVGPDDQAHVELRVDDEAFSIRVEAGTAHVGYGEDSTAPLSLRTTYEPLIAVGDGNLDGNTFARDHLDIERGSRRATGQFLRLLGRAFAR